jgi:hypothetical protein
MLSNEEGRENAHTAGCEEKQAMVDILQHVQASAVEPY